MQASRFSSLVRICPVLASPIHGHALLRRCRPQSWAASSRSFASVTVTFQKGTEGITVTGEEGITMLELAQDNNVDVEGACGGQCACSTCHMILDKELYGVLVKPDDDEVDMLDLASDLTVTSRLGCQMKLTAKMQAAVIQLPATTANNLGV